jgi:hypothetical protein
MRRLHRRTNLRVVAGQVRKKNRTDQSPTWYNMACECPSVHRLKPGFGYHHVLRQHDVATFCRLLPDWGPLSRGLNIVLLAPGSVCHDGWHRPGVVAVCAWERGLWQEVNGQWYAEHYGLLGRLEVPCEEAADGYHLCKFTAPAVRAYQLLHVLLHELGHHHDRMTTRSQADSCRGESYAEGYALAYEPLVWDRYLETFGLY